MLEMETTHMDNHDPDSVAMYIREASNIERLTRRTRRSYSENWVIAKYRLLCCYSGRQRLHSV